MEPKWKDDQPIYRQLRDRIAALLLDGALGEGEALPSVRDVAAQFRVNPITVLKGYQLLVDEGVVESKRGRGMFVLDGARERLTAGERTRFMDEQWPDVVRTVERLGLDWDELLKLRNKVRKGSKQ